jgi:uncharacterized protein (DUF58 family)
VHARELEASVTAPRSGSGNELFGVREYRPGDPLRRIHWRSSARHGELIVREYEPPGVQTVGILCDPDPPSREAADQVARLAASEAWAASGVMDRVPDRIAHPLDLALAALVDRQLEQVGADPARPRRGGRAVVELDALAQRAHGRRSMSGRLRT